MILLAGGVAKKYQPSISTILYAITSNVIAVNDLSSVPEIVSKQERAGTIAFSQSEEPWKNFQGFMDQAKIMPPVLAFYLPAKLGLAHNLAMGLSPDEAAFAWMTTTKSVLEFAKSYRKQVFLVNTDTALNFPQEFIEICVNKYRFNGTEKLQQFSYVSGVKDIHGVLANQIIKQNQDVRRLQQELAARSEPISPYSPPDVFDLNSIVDELNAAAEAQKKEKAQVNLLIKRDAEKAENLKSLQAQSEALVDRNKGLEESKHLLMEQLEAIQNDLALSQASFERAQSFSDGLVKRNKELERSKELLVEHLEAVQAELADSQVSFKEAQLLLKEQLDVVQAELVLSRANPEGKKLLQENETLKADMTALRNDHDTVLKNNKALKADKDIMEAQANYSAKKDELLSDQMQSVQSEAQKTYFNYLQVSNELEELKKVTKWKESKSQRMVEELENDLARTHKRIENLHSSFSWKITRPVRILSRAIGAAGRRNAKEDIQIVEESGLFDREWYIKTYPDLANIAMRPIEHFVKYGAFEGRSPGPDFNTRNYTQKNPNVLIDGQNPLLHYLNKRNGNT